MAIAEEIVDDVFEEKQREMKALRGLVEAGVYEDMEEAIKEAKIAKERRAAKMLLKL